MDEAPDKPGTTTGWYTLVFKAKPGTDPIRSVRRLLKAARRFDLTCVGGWPYFDRDKRSLGPGRRALRDGVTAGLNKDPDHTATKAGDEAQGEAR